MQTIDLLIIGAGPSGISTALHLLQLDPSWRDRLVILESAAHPRHKLCGGGVTQFGLGLLKDLGLPDPLPVPHTLVEDARLVYGRRVVHVEAWPEFAIFHRAELDAYLAAEAQRRGIKILENTPVQSLAFDETGVIVQTPAAAYRARAVVGADGSKGLTRRLMNGPPRGQRVARLLEVLTPARQDAPQFADRYAVFDFTPAQADLQGYTWDFPSWVDSQPRLNRGIYDARIARRRPKARLPDLLAESLSAWGENSEAAELQGHPIHWFSPGNRFAKPRLLLVGDAAGADPLFGEGIAPALGYGRVAAQVLQEGFSKEDLSFQTYRRKVLGSQLGRYLLLRWAIAAGSYRLSQHAWFMNALWTIGKPLAWLRRRARASIRYGKTQPRTSL
jgi:flavin-dependent dehydrogenase